MVHPLLACSTPCTRELRASRRRHALKRTVAARMCLRTRLLLVALRFSWQAGDLDSFFEMPARSNRSNAMKGNRNAKTKPSADQDDPLADAAARAADGAAARAVPTALALASPATCICVCIAPSLIAAIAFCVHAPRPLQMASPHTPCLTRTAQTARSKTNHKGGRTLPPTKPSPNGASSRPWRVRRRRRL